MHFLSLVQIEHVCSMLKTHLLLQLSVVPKQQIITVFTLVQMIVAQLCLLQLPHSPSGMYK